LQGGPSLPFPRRPGRPRTSGRANAPGLPCRKRRSVLGSLRCRGADRVRPHERLGVPPRTHTSLPRTGMAEGRRKRPAISPPAPAGPSPGRGDGGPLHRPAAEAADRLGTSSASRRARARLAVGRAAHQGCGPDLDDFQLHRGHEGQKNVFFFRAIHTGRARSGPGGVCCRRARTKHGPVKARSPGRRSRASGPPFVGIRDPLRSFVHGGADQDRGDEGLPPRRKARR